MFFSILYAVHWVQHWKTQCLTPASTNLVVDEVLIHAFEQQRAEAINQWKSHSGRSWGQGGWNSNSTHESCLQPCFSPQVRQKHHFPDVPDYKSIFLSFNFFSQLLLSLWRSKLKRRIFHPSWNRREQTVVQRRWETDTHAHTHTKPDEFQAKLQPSSFI